MHDFPRTALPHSCGNSVRLGDKSRFEAKSDFEGRRIVLDVDANRKVTLIYTNKFVDQGDVGKIFSGETVTVPGPGYPGFTVFQAAEPLGKGHLVALVAPENFDIERYAADAEIRSRRFVPVNDPPNYVMQLVQQIETFLGFRSRGFEAVSDDLKNWGYAVTEYEILP